MSQLIEQIINGLANGSLYALIAVGYTVVYGIVQLINFAHGEVFMLGAFGSLSTWLLFFQGNTSWWVLPFLLIGGILVSVLVAILMERVAYRPLRNAPRLAPLITAIGISIVLQEIVRLFYDDIPGTDFPDATKANFPQIEGVTGPAFSIGDVVVTREMLFSFSMLLICGAALWWFINRTRTGVGMQAVAQDPDTARLMGINIDRTIMIAFAVGAALAAVAGVSQGLMNNQIGFRMGFLGGLKAFTAAVLGGIGNIPGAIVGGLTLGLVEALATQYIPGGGTWKDVWAFVLLIVVLVFRPQGIMGAKVVDRA